jgi:hypothetical protein
MLFPENGYVFLENGYVFSNIRYVFLRTQICFFQKHRYVFWEFRYCINMINSDGGVTRDTYVRSDISDRPFMTCDPGGFFGHEAMDGRKNRDHICKQFGRPPSDL